MGVEEQPFTQGEENGHSEWNIRSLSIDEARAWLPEEMHSQLRERVEPNNELKDIELTPEVIEVISLLLSMMPSG